MKTSQQKTIICPHCGHTMHITLDSSNGDQDYMEDCSNCCNPIHLQLHINDLEQKIELSVIADDEQFY